MTVTFPDSGIIACRTCDVGSCSALAPAPVCNVCRAKAGTEIMDEVDDLAFESRRISDVGGFYKRHRDAWRRLHEAVRAPAQ